MFSIKLLSIACVLVCGGCSNPVPTRPQSSAQAVPVLGVDAPTRSKLCVYAQRIRGFEGDEYAAVIRDWSRWAASSGLDCEVIFWPNEPAEPLQRWTGADIVSRWDAFCHELGKGAGSPDPEAFYKGLQGAADAALASDLRLVIAAFDLPGDLFTRRLAWAQKIAKRQPVDVMYCWKQRDAVPIASIASGTVMWVGPGAVERAVR
jgi:hypothetical protein